MHIFAGFTVHTREIVKAIEHFWLQNFIIICSINSDIIYPIPFLSA